LIVGLAALTLDRNPARHALLLLANGSQLTVGQVAIDTQGTYRRGSWLVRLADRFRLPPTWRPGPLRGNSVSSITTESTNLLIWLVLHGQPGSPPPRLEFTLSADDPATPPSQPGSFITVHDHTAPLAFGSNNSVIILRESVWPRHAAGFRLQVYEQAAQPDAAPGMRLAGSLRIPNPRPIQREQWPPIPTTAVATAGPSNQPSSAAISLRRFDLRPMPRLLAPIPGPNAVEPRAFLEFEISPSSGTAAADDGSSPRHMLGWALAEVVLRDPLGNRRIWQNPDLHRMAQIGRPPAIRAENLALPWPDEPVYAVETRWLPPGPPLDEERLSVPNVVLSPKLIAPGLVGGGRHPSGRFELYASRGRHAPDPGWIVRVFPRSAPASGPATLGQSPNTNGAPGMTAFASLDATAPRHLLVFLEAHDHQGRRWAAREPDELELPEDAGTVTVILAARPLVPLRFLAAPDRLTSSLPVRRPTR
jgi:hypothetical protein